MVNKYFLVFFFSLISSYAFVSCSKEDKDDGLPTAEFFNIKDGDIIYTDSAYALDVRFTDDKGLSSYAIKIWNSRLKNETDTFSLKSTMDTTYLATTPDSSIFNKAFQTVNIFNIKDTTFTIQNAFKTDSIVNGLPILLGKHYFKMTVVDLRGNVVRDSIRIYLEMKPKKGEIIPD